MRLFVFSFLILGFTALCQAEAGNYLTVQATYPASAIGEVPAPPLLRRSVLPEEIEQWKRLLIGHLGDANVRQILSTKQDAQLLPPIGTDSDSMATFLTRLGSYANEQGKEMQLGLLDAIDLTSLKSQNAIQGSFRVEFIIPRNEFKIALKEILYSAGYVEGLEDVFKAIANSKAVPGKQIGVRAVARKSASIAVAVGKLKLASEFLRTADVKSLEAQPFMENFAPEVEKYLEQDLDSWAKIFCVVTTET